MPGWVTASRLEQPLAEGLSIGAGVNNLLNEDPPFITSEGNQNHDINAYDPIGRFYYFDLTYKF